MIIQYDVSVNPKRSGVRVLAHRNFSRVILADRAVLQLKIQKTQNYEFVNCVGRLAINSVELQNKHSW